MASLQTAAWENTYQAMGSQFYSAQLPTPVKNPVLIRYNPALASFLRLDTSQPDQTTLAILAGNAVPETSQPMAGVYAGHQFGHFNPQLGDGRAILLGEIRANNGALYDVQLKGSGPTRYSRQGDGRSPLGPVLREYIVSEAMAALGIATTRSLAAVATGERVLRDTPLPGAVLTRVASSHIRVGTLQFFAARKDTESVKTLADYTINRHYQAYVDEHFPNEPYLGLLNAVIEAQAKLIARWMSVGFIHGVMNTDNMLLCGETVDYGPCAFMDGYNPQQVYSSIDRQGRYAYNNQPEIAVWNLSWLAQCLLHLLAPTETEAIKKAEQALQGFADIYHRHYQQLFAEKLGFNFADASVQPLVEEFLSLLAQHKLDFSQSFRSLALFANNADCGLATPVNFAEINEGFNIWRKHWLATLGNHNINVADACTKMLATNPIYIPRNHLIQKAIDDACDDQNFDLFNQMVGALAQPHTANTEFDHLASSPSKQEEIICTFCGT
ncbi:protein adenylyltransferase SelO [Halioxenophilus aromaticivorans]|uniref:Protein nucleotidyltransferase YdiU n=1 Tax=Halioxenophilus aromaticivorans TaxID=1306992 RepID=A0AAV3U406_9ALTE